ncbi:MAG: sensor histidine kinase, partial [Chloroflexota bacterium]
MRNEQHIRALIIEDSDGDADLICEVLSEAEGVRIDTERADRVSAGMELLRKKKFDVILSDLGLPDSQGIETFIRLHSQYPDLPIIILTGLSDEELALQALQKGAQDYLVKGQTDIDSLCKSIRYSIERKKLEEEVLRARKLESIRILASGIAHDFNNILQGVIGNISAAKLHLSPEDEAVPLLDNAEKESMRAGALTKQLISLARGGASARKRTSIGDLVKSAAIYSLDRSRFKAEFHLPDDLWAVEVDEGQIMEVVHSIVLNAQEAMPDGGTITIVAENVTHGGKDVLPLEEGGYVKISVSDAGIGIPAENLVKIFDPYFTTKKIGVQKGTGLGLAKCYS